MAMTKLFNEEKLHNKRYMDVSPHLIEEMAQNCDGKL
jgi:hypothetical protein